MSLPPTFSPEYPGPRAPNANYDNALLRWGLHTALQLNTQYDLASPDAQMWRQVATKLVGPSLDSEGRFAVYEGVPLTKNHRHFSHLLALWPLRELPKSGQLSREKSLASLDLWSSLPELDSLFGRGPCAAMNADLGRHAAALDNMTFLVRTRILGSGWYGEGGGYTTVCNEAPYLAAYTLADWLLQSWNVTTLAGVGLNNGPVKVLELFTGAPNSVPLSNVSAYEAAPASIATGSFFRLAAEGGFLVSAVREKVAATDGDTAVYRARTVFVAVESTVGGPCVLRIPDEMMARPLRVHPVNVSVKELGDGGLVQLLIGKGQSAAIWSGVSSTKPPALVVTAKTGCPAQQNFWGGGVIANPEAQRPPPPPPNDAANATVLRPCNFASNGLLSPSQRWKMSTTTPDAYPVRFELLDGSKRCLAVSGASVVLRPCADTLHNKGADEHASARQSPVGCQMPWTNADTWPRGHHDSLSSTSQEWSFSHTFPNGIQSKASGACLEIHGGEDPQKIDLDSCQHCVKPCTVNNMEWKFNASSGALVSLCAPPCKAGGWCLTDAAADPRLGRMNVKTDDSAPAMGPMRVSYASSPALPGQTIMIQGQGLRNLTAQICTHGTGVNCVDADVLSSTEQSAKVLVPQTLRLAQYWLRLCARSVGCTLPTSAATTINTPFISWLQGDQGNFTTSGGWLRLFGRSLAFDSDRCVSDGPRPNLRAPIYDWEPHSTGQAPPLSVGVGGKLVSNRLANDPEFELELVKATCYSLWFRVPAAVPAGRFHLLLRNGLSTNWSGPVAEDGETVGSAEIEIKPVREWPQQKFIVATCQGLQVSWPSWCGTSRDSANHNLTAALNAAAAGGGGVIWLQQGVYNINASLGTLYIPPNTELRGESAKLVSLLWPPFLRQVEVDNLKCGFLAGSDFKLTNLSIYAGPGKFCEVVHVMQNSTRAVLDGLHIRANPYAGLMDAGGDHWKNNVDEDGRFSYSTNVSLSGAVHIAGQNTLVQNCDIEGIGSTTIMLGGGYVHGTVIAKNRIGFAGQLFELGYQATAVFRTIIENNLIYARAPAAMNSMMATYGAARMDMLYVHNNAWANPSSGYASGMISEDGSGGAYNNTVESVSADGLTLTLRNDSLSRPLRLKGQHFIGAAVYVLAGPGKGQWRRVVGFQNQDQDQDEDQDHLKWRIASPFTIPLDPRLSFVVIGPYRGKVLITGNTAVDTQGAFLWGSCLECVIANNVWSRSQAIDLIPLNDHSAGPQPNFRVFVLDNTVRSSMFYRAGYFACGPAPNHLNLGGEGKPCLPNQNPLVSNRIDFGNTIIGDSTRYNSTRPEEQFKNIFLARGLLVRGNTFTRGSMTLGWGLTEVVVEQNEFEGVATGVCLSNNRGQNNHIKPTLAYAAETDMVYRLNTGPTGEAVTMCANCEIAMRTNGYGHLQVEDQRSQCIPINTSRSWLKTDDRIPVSPDQPSTSGISGCTRFLQCGERLCTNMSRQIANIVTHAADIDQIFPYTGDVWTGMAIPNIRGRSRCYANATQTLSGPTQSDPSFRFSSTKPKHTEGDGSGRYLCVPESDAAVRSWAAPIRAAGVQILPIIQAADFSDWSIFEGPHGLLFFDTCAAVAHQHGFSGWSLDWEPKPANSPPSGSVAAQAELESFARFLTAFATRLKSHGLELTTAAPNRELLNTTVPNEPYPLNVTGYRSVANSGSRVLVMSTYYGVMPTDAKDKHFFTKELAAWQAISPPDKLSIGFGALYHSWASTSCKYGGHDSMGVDVDRTSGENVNCLSLAVDACINQGIQSIFLFQLDVFGWPQVINGRKYPTVIAPWPPVAWWPVLRRLRNHTVGGSRTGRHFR